MTARFELDRPHRDGWLLTAVSRTRADMTARRVFWAALLGVDPCLFRVRRIRVAS